jgi:hypothetical protein
MWNLPNNETNASKAYTLMILKAFVDGITVVKKQAFDQS